MTRKKVKLAFIVNDTARKTTYKKRMNCVLKKIDEITTLCGIDGCAIIYSPYDLEPEIWPSPWGVQRVVSKFRILPEFEQSKKKMDQETFINQRILKAKQLLKKKERDNRDKELTLLVFQCFAGNVDYNNLSMVDVNELSCLIDKNLKDIDRRLEAEYNSNGGQSQIMTSTQTQIMNTPSQVQMAPPPSTNNFEITMMGHAHDHFGLGINNGEIMQRQLFGGQSQIMMNPQSQVQMAPPATTTSNIDELAMMGHAHGHGVIMQGQGSMDLSMNENVDETISFGHVNLQNGFWPNLLP